MNLKPLPGDISYLFNHYFYSTSMTEIMYAKTGAAFFSHMAIFDQLNFSLTPKNVNFIHEALWTCQNLNSVSRNILCHTFPKYSIGYLNHLKDIFKGLVTVPSILYETHMIYMNYHHGTSA